MRHRAERLGPRVEIQPRDVDLHISFRPVRDGVERGAHVLVEELRFVDADDVGIDLR